MEQIMRKQIIVIFVSIFILLQTNLFGCTGFCISRDGLVFFGNNEDWKNPNTKMWYVPGENNKYGKVYFGFDDFNPQGGMNDQGLCFDGFATEPKKVTKSLRKPEFMEGNFLDYIMSKCATVEEAIKVFNQYNLNFMERAMFFFADANGDAVIIEGDEMIRKKGDYQVVTNFRQSEVKGENITCQRYRIANQLFKERKGNSIELCKRVLAATHQEGQYPTVYSNIYDLKQRIVYLYHFHNYQNEIRIDLAEELKKGSRRIDLPSLFPKTFVAEVFKGN
jgi:hypothetical protein